MSNQISMTDLKNAAIFNAFRAIERTERAKKEFDEATDAETTALLDMAKALDLKPRLMLRNASRYIEVLNYFNARSPITEAEVERMRDFAAHGPLKIIPELDRRLEEAGLIELESETDGVSCYNISYKGSAVLYDNSGGLTPLFLSAEPTPEKFELKIWDAYKEAEEFLNSLSTFTVGMCHIFVTQCGKYALINCFPGTDVLPSYYCTDGSWRIWSDIK